MAEFDILPDDVKLYILSQHKIYNLRKTAVFVSKEWGILVWQLLQQYYSSGSQDQFSKAFAVSIAQDDTSLFNLLKSIAETNNTKFIIEPYLSIKDQIYGHNFMSAWISPNPKGKERGFYFYLQANDQKIYTLVVHNRYIYETLCITDILHECNESKLIEYIKLPAAVDKKISIYNSDEKLTAIIRKNCKYNLDAYFDESDAIKSWENNDCNISRSLLYLAINRKDYSLASYLIGWMEIYNNQKNIILIYDKGGEPLKKKQKISQEEADGTEFNILTLQYIVDIGYEHHYEELVITPVTSLLLSYYFDYNYQPRKDIDREASILIKRLLRLGATVSINEDYWTQSEFYEPEGYYSEYPDENILKSLLEKELRFRSEIYKEDNEKLKQELENYKTKLLTAEVQIQELKSMLVEQSELSVLNSAEKKRKRDSDDGSILTQFNNLAHGPHLYVDAQPERLDIEENNIPAVNNLFKS